MIFANQNAQIWEISFVEINTVLLNGNIPKFWADSNRIEQRGHSFNPYNLGHAWNGMVQCNGMGLRY